MRDQVDITKEEALACYPTMTALAGALGITKSAVSQWPAGKPIPREHALTLRFVLKPEGLKGAA